MCRKAMERADLAGRQESSRLRQRAGRAWAKPTVCGKQNRALSPLSKWAHNLLGSTPPDRTWGGKKMSIDTAKVANRRNLHFDTIEEILADVECLNQGKFKALGN